MEPSLRRRAAARSFRAFSHGSPVSWCAAAYPSAAAQFQAPGFLPVGSVCEQGSRTAPLLAGGAAAALAAAAVLAAATLAAASERRGGVTWRGAARRSELHCSEPQATRHVVLARADEVKEGELRQVNVPGAANASDGEGGVVLLARIDGQFYCTGASCSHYSAPLAQGVAVKDKMCVVCPWHNAAFDLRTGQPVRGAGLQAIPTYPVTLVDGNVVAEVPRDMADFVKPTTVRRCPNDERVFVVVGGGAAGVAAADTLRQEGYTGRILFLSEEAHLPYDRPVLSKNLAKADDPASLALRDDDYFAEHDIEFRRGAAVQSLDAQAKMLTLASGEEIRYDAALVATGARPRELPIPGGKLPNVMALRTPEDAQRISAACTKGKSVVVIGSSFIGMEAAATLQRRGCEVTVLGMEAVPFETVLGRKLGEAFKAFFESKGVSFVLGSSASEITEKDGGKLLVKLKCGKTLSCDAAVVGVGVVPNTGFVAGAEKARDGSLLTDECLQTSAEGLFAAGDVASYRSPGSGDVVRVEHWDVATSQGRAAAKAMVGKRDPFAQTPFFWTSMFGKNLRYVGHCKQFDDLVIEGDLKKFSFVAYYCHKNVVKAVATMGRDPVAVAAGELMRLGQMPSAADLKAGRASSAGFAEKLRRG